MDKPIQQSRILVIEDDAAIAEGIVRGLRAADFDVELVQNGTLALEKALRQTFDIIVLDLMLPGCDGFQLLEAWRTRISTPVIVLTAVTDLEARLRVFGDGAVDYIAKPFWMEELIARIRLRLQMRDSSPPSTITWSDAVLDRAARIVSVADRPIALTHNEFNLLAYLVERPGRTITRQLLAQHVLSPDGEASDRTVDSHIARVRKKLGQPAGTHIVTVWGIGYRFDRQTTP